MTSADIATQASVGFIQSKLLETWTLDEAVTKKALNGT